MVVRAVAVLTWVRRWNDGFVKTWLFEDWQLVVCFPAALWECGWGGGCSSMEAVLEQSASVLDRGKRFVTVRVVDGAC